MYYNCSSNRVSERVLIFVRTIITFYLSCLLTICYKNDTTTGTSTTGITLGVDLARTMLFDPGKYTASKLVMAIQDSEYIKSKSAYQYGRRRRSLSDRQHETFIRTENSIMMIHPLNFLMTATTTAASSSSSSASITPTSPLSSKTSLTKQEQSTVSRQGTIIDSNFANDNQRRRQQQLSLRTMSDTSSVTSSHSYSNNNNNSNSFWPPWPFNLLQQQQQQQSYMDDGEGSGVGCESLPITTQSYQRRMLLKMFKFTRTSAKVSIRTVQEFGSQLWFHSPPAIPPLILYALWPYRARLLTIGTTTSDVALLSSSDEVIYKTILPIFMNGWVRNIIFFTAGLSILSWAHEEIHRNRLLTPLPLIYHDLFRAELPPFLPEQVSTIFPIHLPTTTATDTNTASSSSSSLLLSATNEGLHEDGETGSSAISTPLVTDVVVDGTDDVDEGILANLSPRIRRHWMQIRNITPRPASFRHRIREWRRMRQINVAERTNAHRLAIYEELVTLQQATAAGRNTDCRTENIKQKSTTNRWNPFRRHTTTTSTDDEVPNVDDIDYDQNHSATLGYALVTGASQGIGRAIAVELARWHIPLILVARDMNKLIDLAYDIQTCYGVDCNVLSADLSKPNAAEQIYKTVTDAGLKVDILVNNAGISSHGETLDMPLADVQRMIQVNAVSVTALTHLFGNDMKERRRGRILLVSSICGAVSGIATVAVYAATKAFENSFGTAIGKELEPYGVGVTCLIPGAVKGTEFRSRSNAHDALCWKIPFYSKTPSAVAECGVRALLCGDTEVTPGVLNRLFLKVMKPILPQRLHNLLAEIMWNPLQLSFRRRNGVRSPSENIEKGTKLQVASNSSLYESPFSQRPIVIRPQLYHSNEMLPRILTIEDLSPDKELGKEFEADLDEPSSTVSTTADVVEGATQHNHTGDGTDNEADLDPKPKLNNESSESKGTNQNLDLDPAQQANEQFQKDEKIKIIPPTSSELDLLLDQYKRLRSISITDPWSNGCNDLYNDSHMLPSMKDVAFELDEV